MVGGPVFGPHSRLKQTAFAFAPVAIATLLCWLLAGCTTHSYLYRPVPAALIPPKPDLPAVQSSELQCLADDVYARLATRDRANRQYAAELRALLEVAGDAER